MQTWTSAGQAAGDPFGRWGDDLAQAFVRLEPRRIGDRRFFGRIAKAAAGPIEVSRVDAAGHQVARLKEHAARAAADVVFVNLQIQGIGLTRQHGKELRTQPFDIVVADTAAPFEIAHRDTFSLYCLALPRRLVPRDLIGAGMLHLSANEMGRHHARMMGLYAALLLDRRASAGDGATYGRHLVELLEICGGHPLDWGAEPPGGVARLPLLLDFLRQNYRDRDLSAASTARAFGISARYVHKLFAATGKSFSEHLGEIRLAACARRLESAGTPPAIIDIALDAGFSDISYFNRCFKARFGETPRDYRRRRQN